MLLFLGYFYRIDRIVLYFTANVFGHFFVFSETLYNQCVDTPNYIFAVIMSNQHSELFITFNILSTKITSLGLEGFWAREGREDECPVEKSA